MEETRLSGPNGDVVDTAAGSDVDSPVGSGASRRRVVWRLGLCCAALCVFVVVASVVRPDVSTAGAGGTERDVTDPSAVAAPDAPPERNAHGWALVGVLRGATHEAWVYASPDGPRYTVIDARGWLVLEDAQVDEVYRAVPEMDLKNLRLEPGEGSGPLMMVDDGAGLP